MDLLVISLSGMIPGAATPCPSQIPLVQLRKQAAEAMEVFAQEYFVIMGNIATLILWADYDALHNNVNPSTP